MREIKFRAWDTSLSPAIMRTGITIGVIGGDDGMQWLYTDNGYLSTPVDDDTIFMQFTGLKDKNGKEIYEGDVVINKIGHWDDDMSDKPIVVKYDSGRFYPWGTGDWDYRSDVYYEVIGNIYENPELLKEVDNEN